jgi:aminoglycoside phosphotransferase family enzyme/predicted kinase
MQARAAQPQGDPMPVDAVFTFADDEERDVCVLLRDPATYGAGDKRVEVVETHIARVFLVGEDAYKLRKRVHLRFVDFSTLHARHAAAVREMEINRPHAPNIYLGLVPIVRTDGRLQLGGQGEIVEWAVHMRRFPQEAVLSHREEQGPIAEELAKALADMVARYHQDSPVAVTCDGGRIMAPVVEQLSSALAYGYIDVADRLVSTFERTRPLLVARGNAACVRRCHGDLHLGNIVLVDGNPVPFDALEFSEALATVDVLYDLAFLLMDLDARGDLQAANAVLNAYVAFEPIGGEIEGLASLPLFLACRAGVRAVVAMARTEQLAVEEQTALRAEIRRNARLADAYLLPPKPVLVAIGGLSGTGKSTLAALLAAHVGPPPGALHVRSDVERKRLFGVPETQRLDRQHYRIGTAERVYDIVEDKARRALSARHAVIVDAVFAKQEEREAMEAIAREAGCPFVGLWLNAPSETLIARVERRRGDASDADRRVVREQLGYDLGNIAWHVVDASGTVAQSVEEAQRVLAATPIKPAG